MSAPLLRWLGSVIVPFHLLHSAQDLTAHFRVARRYHKKLRRMSQRRLKQVLRTVPVYAQLLEENPDARIIVDAGAWDSAT